MFMKCLGISIFRLALHSISISFWGSLKFISSVLQELIQRGDGPAMVLHRCPVNQNDWTGMHSCIVVYRGRGLPAKSTTTAPALSSNQLLHLSRCPMKDIYILADQIKQCQEGTVALTHTVRTEEQTDLYQRCKDMRGKSSVTKQCWQLFINSSVLLWQTTRDLKPVVPNLLSLICLIRWVQVPLHTTHHVPNMFIWIDYKLLLQLKAVFIIE